MRKNVGKNQAYLPWLLLQLWQLPGFARRRALLYPAELHTIVNCLHSSMGEQTPRKRPICVQLTVEAHMKGQR